VVGGRDEGTARRERAALVALLRERPGERGWAEITAGVLEAGSAVSVRQHLVPPVLVNPPGEADPLDAAAAQIARWADQGWRLLSILDADYPARLRGIHQAPPVLFARGTLVPGDVAVSVVGSRKASPRGLGIAAGVARELAARGVTVLGGLALGIDTAAHRAALAAGGGRSALSELELSGPIRRGTGACRRRSPRGASCSPSSGRTRRRSGTTS